MKKRNMKYLGMMRPDFEDILEKELGEDRQLQVVCGCREVLYTIKEVYSHWLRGHFDEILERELTAEELGDQYVIRGTAK